MSLNSKNVDGYIAFPFMQLWGEAYYWLDQWGIPIEEWQRKYIPKKLEIYPIEPVKKQLSYFITEHCENLPKQRVPEEFNPLIEEYKIHMMKLWGWPEWGYKSVKHLKGNVDEKI